VKESSVGGDLNGEMSPDMLTTGGSTEKMFPAGGHAGAMGASVRKLL
jgi:hypothetical protein